MHHSAESAWEVIQMQHLRGDRSTAAWFDISLTVHHELTIY